MDAQASTSTGATGGQKNYEYTWAGYKATEKELDDCLFYDPKAYKDVFDWVRDANPFSRFSVHNGDIFAAICLHPKYDDDIPAFKRNNRRYKSVPNQFRKCIAHRKEVIQSPENKHLEYRHPELLSMVEQSNIWDGFWFILFRSFRDQPSALKRHFVLLTRKLRAEAKRDKDFKFTKLEATVEGWNGCGVLRVSVEDFTDLPLVTRVGAFLRAYLMEHEAAVDISAGHLAIGLYFKPEFYYLSNLDCHFSSDVRKNIYRVDIVANVTVLRYEDGVKEWVEDYLKRKSLKAQLGGSGPTLSGSGGKTL